MSHQTDVALPHIAVERRPKVDHWFYIGVGLFMILTSMAGFSPSIVDPARRNGPVTPVVIAHGALMVSWLLLFLTQATLVATGRTHVHRRLGWLGPVLALAIIGLAFVMSIETTRRTHDLSGDITRAAGGPITPNGILFPLLSLFNFGVLVGAAVWFRHRPEVHKRLMLFAMLQPIIGEPITHLTGHVIGHLPALGNIYPLVAGVSMIMLLSVSAIHDRLTQRRIHPVSLWVPIALFVWVNVSVLLILPAGWWIEFATWLVS